MAVTIDQYLKPEPTDNLVANQNEEEKNKTRETYAGETNKKTEEEHNYIHPILDTPPNNF